MKKFIQGFFNYRKMFTPPTIDEVIEGSISKEMLTLQLCDVTIRTARFQKHMSNAHIEAMIEWREIEKAEAELNFRKNENTP